MVASADSVQCPPLLVQKLAEVFSTDAFHTMISPYMAVFCPEQMLRSSPPKESSQI